MFLLRTVAASMSSLFIEGSLLTEVHDSLAAKTYLCDRFWKFISPGPSCNTWVSGIRATPLPRPSRYEKRQDFAKGGAKWAQLAAHTGPAAMESGSPSARPIGLSSGRLKSPSLPR